MSIYPPLHETNPRRLRARQATSAHLPESTSPEENLTAIPSVLRIGLQANSIDPFWVEVRETIWYASQRGDRGDGTVSSPQQPAPLSLIEVDTLPDDLVGEEFATRLEAILALELDVLIAVPSSMRFIEALLAKGLPVVALHHRDLVHPLFSCLPELYPSARMVCQHLVEIMGGNGRIMVVGGQREYVRSAPSSRLQAALDVFGLAPGIEWVRIPAPWDYAGAVDALLEGLAETEEQFDGIFGMSDSLALAGREVCVRLGLLAPDGLVVGINGDPLAIAAIANGNMTATVATSAYEVAHESLKVARMAARGETIPPNFDYRPQLVTRANVADAALQRLVHIAALPSRLVGANRRQETQRLADMETSNAINQRIGALLDRDQLLQEIGNLILTRYGYDKVCVYLWESETQSLVLQEPNTTPQNRMRLLVSHGSIPGRAFLTNRAVYLPDVLASWRFAADPECPNLRTRTAVPIRLGTRTLGVLDLRSLGQIHHSQLELSALQLLADQIGVGLENARLYALALEARATAERADSFKTRLLTNISHELRAPLNTILGYSQAGLNDPASYGAPLPDSLLADLQRVQHAGEQLVQLVDDLLSLSQAEIGALEIVSEEIDVGALLSELVALRSGASGTQPGNGQTPVAANAGSRPESVTWRLVLPDQLPTVWGDPVRLRQLFLDLISNAQKFTDYGNIEVGAAAERCDLHIWIADTGVGIPATQLAQLNRLFANREQIEESGGNVRDSSDDSRLQPRSGMGLGLSVAHHIARLHGGEIAVESALGQGTVCHVRLPFASADALVAPIERPALASEASQVESNERVLKGVLAHASELTRQIADFLAANFTGNVTREEIAAEMRVSADYVSRVFRKETGMTPWQYLARYRILQAQRLLMTTNQSITEIANAVGFNDAAYFVRVFHRETGKAPQRYRKSIRSGA
jgi:signal transduction histidine kinase/AraC-like DNA-binding protein/ABC-type sugar transport system substrate-binding protein